jgi:hypothetical protein
VDPIRKGCIVAICTLVAPLLPVLSMFLTVIRSRSPYRLVILIIQVLRELLLAFSTIFSAAPLVCA